MSNDNVNHPSHYLGKVEVIDYIEDKLTDEQFEGYLVGNVLKYISRYRKKNGIEDLKKCQWYLSKLIIFKDACDVVEAEKEKENEEYTWAKLGSI